MTQPVGTPQIEAMISLLSDPNQEVVARCREALMASASEAEAPLEHALRHDVRVPKRLLRRLLADVTGERREAELAHHLSDEADLERGSILLGALVEAGDKAFEVPAALDALADQVASQLAGQRDPDRDLAVLRTVLTEQLKPEARSPNIATLEDALLHGVTGGRGGMPLPICICWILVARRLSIPIVGVNFPGHFLVRYDVPGRLLVLDPFGGGQPVDLDHCRAALSSMGAKSTDLEALDATDLDMLRRSLRNVIQLAARHGERALLERAGRLLASTAAS
ncbi:MAG: hypothetical protein DHS20C15_09140 [Planctomycetota bacterium]|nr:MAG: hypothetical protein DHS20C15_09140 [Planctomycetota bacterium]